jgi:leucyl aminopeptidase
MIGCATLTGAARVALGPEVQALFCNDTRWRTRSCAQLSTSPIRFWALPIWKPYRRMIEASIADSTTSPTVPFAGLDHGASICGIRARGPPVGASRHHASTHPGAARPP